MKDLSLHILDIVQNSIHAGANEIEINIMEDRKDRLHFFIRDNGSGIEKKLLTKVTDPFYTTGEKRTGLGLPLLEQKAKQCEGSFSIVSKKGKGTTVSAEFQKNHIDMPPLGDMSVTMKLLIYSFPEIHFIYSHMVRAKAFVFDTLEVKQILGEVEINNPEVLRFIEEMITGNLQDIGAIWAKPENSDEKQK